MPHRRWSSFAAVVALIGCAALAGCARPGTVSQTGTSADASAPVPTSGPAGVTPTPAAEPGTGTPVRTLPPPKPPRTPSDPMPSDILVGRVTRGGSGPCYGMETDEGVTYALFGGNGVSLAEGDTVRVWFEQLRVLVDCGPGRPVSIVRLEIVR